MVRLDFASVVNDAAEELTKAGGIWGGSETDCSSTGCGASEELSKEEEVPLVVAGLEVLPTDCTPATLEELAEEMREVPLVVVEPDFSSMVTLATL